MAKKKTKKILWAILIVIILAIAIYSLLLVNTRINPFKTVAIFPVGIGDDLNFLKDCALLDDPERSSMGCPPQPEQEVLDELEATSGLIGVLICNSNYADYEECSNMVQGCDSLGEIVFESSATSGGNSPTYSTYAFYQCGNVNYLAHSTVPPPRIRIFTVELTQEQLIAIQ